MTPRLVRFRKEDLTHSIAIGVVLETGVEMVHDVTPHFGSIGQWLRASVGRVEEAIAYTLQIAEKSEPVSVFQWLAPLDEQEVWASGVTYEKSREARQEESQDGGDIYARVYEATRPELFFKALGKNAIGTQGHVGIRADATWSVPEPELVVVLNPAMEVVGFCVGNDMSSRDIEGENPLYLPQAKVYTASCAVGPGILLAPSQTWPEATISLRIERDRETVFVGEIHTDRIRRTLPELVAYLGRSNHFPDGIALMTGTGIVPDAPFTLQEDDKVDIEISGIGAISNRVKVV